MPSSVARTSSSGHHQQQAGTTASRPRMGVLATHAIQYQAPLYQDISRRAVVDLEVAFLSQNGARAYHDHGFGITVEWDIDLLSGYRWITLEHQTVTDKASFPLKLGKWLRRQDAVVLHGHSDPRMLFAAALCRALRVPIYCAGNLMPKPQLLDGVSSRGTHLPGSVSAARQVHCRLGNSTRPSMIATRRFHILRHLTALTTPDSVLSNCRTGQPARTAYLTRPAPMSADRYLLRKACPEKEAAGRGPGDRTLRRSAQSSACWRWSPT